MRSINRKDILAVVKAFLLHALLVWLVINVSSAVSYWYRVSAEGNYLFYEDGSSPTVWDRLKSLNLYQLIYIPILFTTLLMELNYYLIFRRYHLFVFLVTCLLTGWLARVFTGWFNIQQTPGMSSLDIYSIVLLAGYALLYGLARDAVYRYMNRRQLQYEKTRAELSAIRAQLQPHFFFNSLNTVYATALKENAGDTAELISKISGMMRYVLSAYESEKVPVSGEISFLENYLQLQRMRLPDRKNISLNTLIENDAVTVMIAPLLWLPFIENAFKYGISMDRACQVAIYLKVDDRQLLLTTENSYWDDRPEQPGAGSGISSTKRRLELQYPGKHRLTISKKDQGFYVRLEMDLAG